MYEEEEKGVVIYEGTVGSGQWFQTRRLSLLSPSVDTYLGYYNKMSYRGRWTRNVTMGPRIRSRVPRSLQHIVGS